MRQVPSSYREKLKTKNNKRSRLSSRFSRSPSNVASETISGFAFVKALHAVVESAYEPLASESGSSNIHEAFSASPSDRIGVLGQTATASMHPSRACGLRFYQTTARRLPRSKPLVYGSVQSPASRQSAKPRLFSLRRTEIRHK